MTDGSLLSKVAGKIASDISFYSTKLRAQRHHCFIIDSKEPQDLHFAFFGEFGYSLQAWLPYVKFLKENTPHRIHTHASKGSASLYSFSDSHAEHGAQYNDIAHGHVLKYLKLEKEIGQELIFPSNQTRSLIRICGYDWQNSVARSAIKTDHYSPLDHDFDPLFADIPRPYAVVNNKNYYNWGNSAIVNFFKNYELYEIAKRLREKGLTLVYNAFPDSEEDENLYVDNLVDFKGQSSVFDMREVYKGLSDPNEMNRIQLSLYHNANYVIAVQGGNAVLPLTCRKDTYILMRGGFDYVFYKSLEKIYKCRSECFYEPSHLIQHTANL